MNDLHNTQEALDVKAIHEYKTLYYGLISSGKLTRHSERIWLLFSNFYDFVKNAWFSAVSYSGCSEFIPESQEDRQCFIITKPHRKWAFTRLVKHFRSDSSLVKLTQPLAQSACFLPINGYRNRQSRLTCTLWQKSASQTKFRSKAAHSYGACFAALNESASAKPMTLTLRRKCAFTLAETLITLTILGIVAALTVPNLVRRQVEISNRVKIKKAVGVYDSLMTKLTIKNNLKSNAAIQEWADADCTNSSDLFKVVKFVNTDNKCKFKTADGVFWDITDIQKPIIALKEKDLNDATAQSDTNRAFYMFTEYDRQGILRISEQSYDYSLNLSDITPSEVNDSVERLYAFINGQSTTKLNKIAIGWQDKCISEDGNNYTCEGSTLSWKKKAIASTQHTAKALCEWDGKTCTNKEKSEVSAGDILVSDTFTVSDSDAQSACSDSRNENCTKDYWNAARHICEQNEAHLATIAELKALYNSENKGGLVNNSIYWAAEAYSSDASYSYDFTTVNGIVNKYSVSNKNFKAVCVGN